MINPLLHSACFIQWCVDIIYVSQMAAFSYRCTRTNRTMSFILDPHPVDTWLYFHCDPIMCFCGTRYNVTHDGNSSYGNYTMLSIILFRVTVDAASSPWVFHTLRLIRQFQIDFWRKIYVSWLYFPWGLVTKRTIHFKSALICIMAWRWTGDNLFIELVMSYFTNSYMRHSASMRPEQKFSP